MARTATSSREAIAGRALPRRARTLADPSLDAKLRAQGYLAVPFLEPTEVCDLLDAYRTLASADDDGLVIDFLRPNREVMHEVAALLAPVWARHLPELFADHRVAVATFVTKHPGGASAMALHEEPTFVDERRYRSHAVWIPLVDVSPAAGNGHLVLLPHSAELERGWAGYNTPVQHRPYEHLIQDGLVSVDAPAGTAVVYDSRTLHGSGPNRTDQPRFAIAASIVPTAAPLVHVVATGARGRSMHAVGDDFYLDVHPATVARCGVDGPVVAATVEDQLLDPRALATLLARGPADVVPRPVVPGDVAGLLGTEPGRSTLAARRLPRPRGPLPDLEVDPALAVGSSGATHLEVESSHRAELARLDRRAARRHRRRLGWPARRSARVSSGADLVVVSPGGRLRTVSGAPLQIIVVEGPAVNAGIATSDGTVNAAGGDVFEVASPGPIAWWNDGPGPLVAVVHPSRAGRR